MMPLCVKMLRNVWLKRSAEGLPPSCGRFDRPAQIKGDP